MLPFELGLTAFLFILAYIIAAKAWKINKIFGIVTGIFASLTVIAILMPMKNTPRAGQLRKMCFAKIRVLEEAIEFFNESHEDKITSFDETVVPRLIEAKFLKSDIGPCPGKPVGEYIQDKKSIGKPKLVCTVHGSHDNPAGDN